MTHGERVVFGRCLALRRIARGLSQKDLSEAIGVGEKVLSTWESGVRVESIRLHDLMKLAAFYRVSIDQLGNGENLPKAHEIAEGRRTFKFKRRGKGGRLHGGQLGTMAITASDHAMCEPGSASICAECRAVLAEVTTSQQVRVT